MSELQSNSRNTSHSNSNTKTVKRNKDHDTAQYKHIKTDSKFKMPQDVVMVLVGKWAMPTTVVLVLITCLAGYYLEVEAFTPVVGMIAPVVMALIMVIKEASVGKEEDEAIKDREREREERVKQYNIEKDIKLAQMAYEEKRHVQELAEKARQFDMTQSATRDFVSLAKDMNNQLADSMKKETELVMGDTHIKLADGKTSLKNKIQNKSKKKDYEKKKQLQ
ncbi:hypothetical protein [Pseudoalteromonas denitrificans]|uniref:Uncharacterized protein n=1 Tax=Pseudoalteromonas denitrificans DSM 6059 TaxID=1123010 RepID=A0A1I1G5U5_9GAMM|nr:hypothetical protein [Pseudoalteromonas denitrificans]SFC07169.1 hypothetical protein SAMN02745724_00834 [Pseudoalteromonas denitrificans DSM 6059]